MELDEEQVARLAFDGASNREIAAIVGCDESTIRDRFPALLTKKRAERRVWLRAAQNKAVDAGIPTMLIWMGKQELDQSDKAEVRQKTETTIVELPPKDTDAEDSGPAGPADAVPGVEC